MVMDIHRMFKAVVIVSSYIAYSVTGQCPSNGKIEPTTGTCYWKETNLTDAITCNETCTYKQAVLAEVPCATANTFIRDEFFSNSDMWIGINDLRIENNFTDFYGQLQSYFNWEYTQPNDPGNQDCVIMSTGDNGQWQDRNCLSQYECLCSFKALCPCSSVSKVYTQEELEELIKELQIDKKNTNAAIRKRTCAKDDRPSAQNIGCIGVVFLVIVYGLPILTDLVYCLKKRSHTKKFDKCHKVGTSNAD